MSALPVINVVELPGPSARPDLSSGGEAFNKSGAVQGSQQGSKGTDPALAEDSSNPEKSNFAQVLDKVLDKNEREEDADEPISPDQKLETDFNKVWTIIEKQVLSNPEELEEFKSKIDLSKAPALIDELITEVKEKQLPNEDELLALLSTLIPVAVQFMSHIQTVGLKQGAPSATQIAGQTMEALPGPGKILDLETLTSAHSDANKEELATPSANKQFPGNPVYTNDLTKTLETQLSEETSLEEMQALSSSSITSKENPTEEGEPSEPQDQDNRLAAKGMEAIKPSTFTQLMQSVNNSEQAVQEIPHIQNGQDASTEDSSSRASQSLGFRNSGLLRESQVIPQIIKGFLSVQKDGGQTLKMHLHPEHLGRVKLSIEIQGQMLTGRMLVENDQVRSQLETQLQALRQSLEGQGLNIDALEVAVDDSAKFENLFNQKDQGPSQGKNRLVRGVVEENLSEMLETEVSFYQAWGTRQWIA